MKNLLFRLAVLCMILTGFTSCELIGDIFQAGMGVGIFLVIIVIAIVVWVISKFRK